MSGSVYRDSKMKAASQATSAASSNDTTSSSNSNSSGSRNISVNDLDPELFNVYNSVKMGDENYSVNVGDSDNSVNVGDFDAGTISLMDAYMSVYESSGGGTSGLSIKIVGTWGVSTDTVSYKARWYKMTIPSQSAISDSSFYTPSGDTAPTIYENTVAYDIVNVVFDGLKGIKRKVTRDFGWAGIDEYGTEVEGYYTGNGREEGILPVPNPTYTFLTKNGGAQVDAPPVTSTSISKIWTGGNSTSVAVESTGSAFAVSLPTSLTCSGRGMNIKTQSDGLSYNGFDPAGVFPVEIDYGDELSQTIIRGFNDIPNDRVDAYLSRTEDSSGTIHYNLNVRNMSPYDCGGSATLILM